ncbi:MAG: hypothetical protein LBU86_04440 [Oscillospiraceae bacterium]|jgi:hypothetical protein|nr:hypothetical protein [Oscillospiraceae bacterium]
MAEITKVTTPLIPRENPGKSRPLTEQAAELNNPQKVNRPADDSKILDHETSGRSLREMLGRTAMAPVLRGSAEVIGQLQKMVNILQMGISTSEIITGDPIKQLLSQMFVGGDRLFALLMEQDASATIFKGDAFNLLRDIAGRFEQNPAVKGALANVLKSFEYNVNLDNSVKTILYQCENLLDYMFSKDRTQFGQYLDSLESMLMTGSAEDGIILGENGLPVRQGEGQSPRAADNAALFAGSRMTVNPKEAASVLKNNLLPLLGEIVVKYYQSESIRDIVMVVVHNIVRVDKGTPEAIQESVENFTDMLGRFANLGENFAKSLTEALSRASERVKASGNDVMEKISKVISETLRSSDSSPAALRQAENLLLGLLHNQSSTMNLLQYILPLDMGNDRVYAEMYVDPDSEEASGAKEGEHGRKVFLAVESESHGSMELCFWQTGERVEISMWCPEALVGPVNAMKKTLRELAAAHGYTMTGFSVEELKKHHSIIQVFPKLMERKVGIDVRV